MVNLQIVSVQKLILLSAVDTKAVNRNFSCALMAADGYNTNVGFKMLQCVLTD